MAPLRRATGTWIVVAIAITVTAAIVAVVVGLWDDIGPNSMSAAGWFAMVLGVVATLGLGIGLMSLMFISNRRGYDDSDPTRG